MECASAWTGSTNSKRATAIECYHAGEDCGATLIAAPGNRPKPPCPPPTAASARTPEARNGRSHPRELSLDQAGLVSVNDVEVSGDLRQASVFVSIWAIRNSKRTACISCSRPPPHPGSRRQNRYFEIHTSSSFRGGRFGRARRPRPEHPRGAGKSPPGDLMGAPTVQRILEGIRGSSASPSSGISAGRRLHRLTTRAGIGPAGRGKERDLLERRSRAAEAGRFWIRRA